VADFGCDVNGSSWKRKGCFASAVELALVCLYLRRLLVHAILHHPTSIQTPQSLLKHTFHKLDMNFNVKARLTRIVLSAPHQRTTTEITSMLVVDPNMVLIILTSYNSSLWPSLDYVGSEGFLTRVVSIRASYRYTQSCSQASVMGWSSCCSSGSS
jgi:hypothetical protein